jgi:threonine dehydratase
VSPDEAEVTRADVAAAYVRIAPHARRTPLMDAASPIAGAPPISLKLEFLQHSGSFKARGAFHNLITRPAPVAGCATASGGNHGAAVAYAANRLGIRAKVFVPEISSPAKIGKIKAYGADVHVEGATYADALALCDAHVAATGAMAIHAYDAFATIAGQGTVGLEWEQDLERLGLPAIDTALIAVGGGGLTSGVTAWFAGRIKIVGVEPEGSRALDAALVAGRPVDVPVRSIAADSLGARRVGDRCFSICRRAGVEVALVSDEAIVAARRALWRDFNVLSEPGGAAAYAALASGAYIPAAGERVGVLLCGANAHFADMGGEV